jgi:hypothetical protein
MSAQEICAALEQMEAWIADPAWDPDPVELARWNTRLLAAKAEAETEAGWPELVARAHALGQPIETRLRHLAQVRDEIRAELEALECGNRAIRSYGASTR